MFFEPQVDQAARCLDELLADPLPQLLEMRGLVADDLSQRFEVHWQRPAAPLIPQKQQIKALLFTTPVHCRGQKVSEENRQSRLLSASTFSEPAISPQVFGYPLNAVERQQTDFVRPHE
jgi:hypothetical protein